MASDEDLDGEIDSLLAHLCAELAPVLQTVPGAHWDFIFDLMESNLEVSLFDASYFGVTLIW